MYNSEKFMQPLKNFNRLPFLIAINNRVCETTKNMDGYVKC